MRPLPYLLFLGACSTPSSPADSGAPPADASESSASACPTPDAITTVADQPSFAIGGETSTIADPSAFYPPNAPGGALAYSSVPDQANIRTHVAVSNDLGATWTYVAEANQPTSVPPPACPDGGVCSATIVNETSSIVYDATDPDTSRRWKLFTHRYVVVEQSGQNPMLLYTIGNIGMYTAPLPAGPWSAVEVALGWPGSSLSTTGAHFLSTSDPGTSMCGAFGEPGATIAPDGSIHLAVGCIQPPFATPTIDIKLLRSADHGASWSYVSTPVSGADGTCFGGSGDRVNAVDLFVAASTEYLMVTPEGPSSRSGCVVVPFSDSSAGVLRRNPQGALLASRFLQPQFDSSELAHYAGACTFSEGATAMGYTISHLLLRNGMPPSLHEIATHQGL